MARTSKSLPLCDKTGLPQSQWFGSPALIRIAGEGVGECASDAVRGLLGLRLSPCSLCVCVANGISGVSHSRVSYELRSVSSYRRFHRFSARRDQRRAGSSGRVCCSSDHRHLRSAAPVFEYLTPAHGSNTFLQLDRWKPLSRDRQELRERRAL